MRVVELGRSNTHYDIDCPAPIVPGIDKRSQSANCRLRVVVMHRITDVVRRRVKLAKFLLRTRQLLLHRAQKKILTRGLRNR